MPLDVKSSKTEMKQLLMVEVPDCPRIIWLQTDTFSAFWEWIQKLVDGDVHSIMREYPILKEDVYIEKGFQLMERSQTAGDLEGNLTELLQMVDKVNGKDTASDNARGSDGGDEELLNVFQELCVKIKMVGKTDKEHKPVLSCILSTQVVPEKLLKPSDPSRFILLDNSSGFVTADGVSVLTKKTSKGSW